MTHEPTNDAVDAETPAIQIDDDWKAEAQADKAKLAEQEQAAGDAGGATGKDGANALPPADFKGLVGVLASQAVMGLGAMPDPKGRGVMIDLDGAKFAIDLLAVIEEKTAGNLTDEESAEISGVVVELRARFVQVTQLLAEQVHSGAGGAGGPGAAGPAASSGTSTGGGASKIIMPD